MSAFFKIPSLFFGAVLLVSLLYNSSCNTEQQVTAREDALASKVVLGWTSMLIHLERASLGYQAPVSARMYACNMLAAYAAALPSGTDHPQLSALLPAFQPVHFQANDVRHFMPPASINTAFATMSRKFFPAMSVELQRSVDSLETAFSNNTSGMADEASLAYSRNFGRRTADAVWRWMLTDTVAWNGLMYCTGCNFIPDSCASCWKPDAGRSAAAMLPYWGNTRTIFTDAGALVPAPPIPFSEIPGSDYYNQAIEVMTSSQPLSKNDHWLAAFWSDDLTPVQVTPPGRWMDIATGLMADKNVSPKEMLEILLRMTAAVNDAYIIGWKWKYHYQLERPQTYIDRVIQPGWESYAAAPPYPAYPATHALVAAAAAAVLTSAFGENCAVTDHTYENLEEFAGMPRTFPSFKEMAEKVALSRLILGIHYRMDCEEGMRLGNQLGNNIAAIKF